MERGETFMFRIPTRGIHMAQQRGIRFPGRLANRITSIRPLYRDIVGPRIEQLDEWRCVVRSNFPKHPLRSAVLGESDQFLEVLERFDEASQRTVFQFDRAVMWMWEEAQQSSVKNFELAPRGTEVGDFVIQISGMERAVIVRESPFIDPRTGANHGFYKYKINGCAGIARVRLMASQ